MTLTLAGDDIDSIAIGERSVLDCGTADYSLYPYSVTIADYPLQNDADGLEYLEVCFKDLAGNVTSAVASITKDTTAPNGELVLNNADAYTTSVYVDVTLGKPTMRISTTSIALVLTRRPWIAVRRAIVPLYLVLSLLMILNSPQVTEAKRFMRALG